MGVRAIANRPGSVRTGIQPSRHAPLNPGARGWFWMRNEARA